MKDNKRNKTWKLEESTEQNRTELKRIITLTLSTQEDNDTEPYFRGFFTI